MLSYMIMQQGLLSFFSAQHMKNKGMKAVTFTINGRHLMSPFSLQNRQTQSMFLLPHILTICMILKLMSKPLIGWKSCSQFKSN